MIHCLIFDLFGTLVEYEAGRTRQDFSASHSMAAELGCSATYPDFVDSWDDAFRRMALKVATDLSEFHMNEVCELVVNELGISADTGQKEALVSGYIADWAAQIVPVPGGAGLLKRLANHYRLGLISNTHYPPMVHSLLADMGISGLFDTITLSVDLGRAKPHPEIFEYTLGKLGVKSDAAVYVGDSFEHDYAGARGVGMDCYLIGKHARVPRDHQLRSILDLAISFETARK